MRTSQDTDKISAALAKAQAALTNPKRNRKVEMTLKSGRTLEYSYATLDTIFELLQPVLKECELSIQQGVQQRAGETSYWLLTRVLHSSGQYVETDTPLPYTGSTDAQQLGSAMSYSRRYGVTAIFGRASEEDDDGKLATKEKKEGFRAATGAGERLGEEERNRMVDVATVVQDFARQGKFDEALKEWEGTDFKDNADAKVFAWDRLPAPTRSTLKRMAREKAANP